MSSQLEANRLAKHWDEQCLSYIDTLYHDVKASPNYSIEETLAAMHQQISLTYGEVMFFGLKKLFQRYPLTADDVFIDCGSGLGKLLVQALLTTPAKKVIGVEVEQTLAKMSEIVADNVLQECAPILNGRTIEVQAKSFFDSDVSDATVMFCCSTCFTEEMMYSIGAWMNQQPKLHTVMSLKPIPSLEGLKFVEAVPVECTWDTAQCYVYRAEERLGL